MIEGLDLSGFQELADREAEVAFPYLEELMVSPDYFGLTTASHVQRAIWYVMDGRQLPPELAEREDVLRTFGGVIPDAHKRKEMVNLSGIRTAKSMGIAAHAVRSTQVVDLTPCLDTGGEIPRYSVLSLELDNAADVHKHLLGAIFKPKLRPLRLDPRSFDGDEEFERWLEIIKRTGGQLVGREFIINQRFQRPIEIRIVAGKRAGASVISKWSAGIALDEAPRMTGYGESVVNLEETRRAGIGRILDGGQLLMVGSAYEDHGPVYEIVTSEFGKPSPERVVAAAKGYDANPVWWTPKRCDALKKADPVAYKMDVECEFAGAPTQLYPESVQIIVRRDRDTPMLPYDPRVEYVCAMDPATRGNAWTFVIVGRYTKLWEKQDAEGKTIVVAKPWDRVAYFTEWVGTSVNPVSARTVFREARPVLNGYGLDYLVSDQWSIDAHRDIADEEGIAIIEEKMNQETRVNAFLGVLERAKDGQLEWPDDPKFNRDMKGVRKKPGKKPGDIDIILVKTPDGRHADYAAATVRAHWQMLSDERQVEPEMYTPEWFEYQDRLAEERELREQIEMLQESDLETFYG